MKKLALFLFLFALPHFSWGQLVLFQATLTGSQETPPNTSTATGFGSGVLNLSTLELAWTESFTGLTGGNGSAAHFHVGAPGVAGPVIIPFPGFPAATSGNYSISVILTPLQESQLLGGLFYANIHDAVYPGGEIRGQLVAVPEPSAYALSGVAALGLFVLIRRSRTALKTPAF